jgi:hypothetical protein
VNQDRPLANGADEDARQVDELLRRYLCAKDEADSSAFAGQLIRDYAEPVARFVVSYKL